MEDEKSLEFDWANYVSVFEVDPMFEGIRAPMWTDFLKGRDHPYDDYDVFFCKRDCIHPKNADSLINSTSFQSPRVKQPRTKLDPLRTSNTTPLGDRTASTLNCKKSRAAVASSLDSLSELKATEKASNPNIKRRGALLSTSTLTWNELKANELKANENASRQTNIKKSSTMDRNKDDWKFSRNFAYAENDNPSPRGATGAARNIKKSSNIDRNRDDWRSSKHLADAENDHPNSPRGVSGAASIVRIPRSQSMKYTADSPAKVSKHIIAAKELQRPLSTEKKGVSKQASRTASRTPSTGSPCVTGEKKGVVKESNQLVTSAPSSTISPVDQGCEIKGSIKQLSCNTNTELTTPTQPARPTTNRNPTNDHKSSSALKSAFSASVLLSKGPSRDILSQLSGLYSGVMKNVWNTGAQKDSAEQSDNPVQHGTKSGNDENVNSQDINSNCLSESKYERCSHSGYHDPDQSSQSGPLILNALRQRGNTNAGKICSKSVDFKTFNAAKNEDPVRTRDRMTSTWLSTLHMHEDEEEESLGDEEFVLMEKHNKSSQSKLFSPSTWKKSFAKIRRNEDGDKKGAHSSKKHNLKADRADKKVQSSPPSVQKVSRLSSSSNQGKKSTTPVQPFRFRTSERSTAREVRKLQRSNTCDENMLTSSESKINVPDMLWLFKRCAYMN